MNKSALIIGLVALLLLWGCGPSAAALHEARQAGYEQGLKDGESSCSLADLDALDEAWDEGYAAGKADTQCDLCLNRPTYDEVLDLLADNKADEIEAKCKCIDRAVSIADQCREEGIWCKVVVMNYQKGSHVIVAFDTVDKGTIYIEPSNDSEVVVELGEDYGKNFGRTGLVVTKIGIFK